MLTAPILVTGLPRSGTSMVAGILSISGAWMGDTIPGDALNRKGYFENAAIRDGMVKPLLKIMGADPLGLKTLPVVSAPPPISGEWWSRHVHAAVYEQGYRFGPWALKDAKLVLCWQQWAAAFPDAQWVVVRRPIDQVIASAMRADPMVRHGHGFDYGRWKQWASEYVKRLEGLLSSSCKTFEIEPAEPISGRIKSTKALVDNLGLTWRGNETADFIDAKLWNRGRNQ